MRAAVAEGGGVAWAAGDEGTLVKNEKSLVCVLFVAGEEEVEERDGEGEAGPGEDLERFILGRFEN